MSIELDKQFAQDTIHIIEKEIGLHKGFLSQLLDENDWAFVIKIEAFLEGVLSHILVKLIGRDELQDVFIHLDMGNSKYGKVIWAYRLKLIGSKERNFLTALLELRNQFAHNIIFTNVSLTDYLDQLASHSKTSDKAKYLINHLNYFGGQFEDLQEGKRIKSIAKDMIRGNPKFGILLGVMALIDHIYHKKETRKALEALYKKMDALTLPQ